MASSCVDRRSQTFLNNQNLNTEPTVKPDGTYTSAQIDVFAKELADNIIAETNSNPIQNMVNRDFTARAEDFLIAHRRELRSRKGEIIL